MNEAIEQRRFLKKVGLAIVEGGEPDISGVWQFPFAELTLSVRDGIVVGKGENKVPKAIGLLAGGANKDNYSSAIAKF